MQLVRGGLFGGRLRAGTRVVVEVLLSVCVARVRQQFLGWGDRVDGTLGAGVLAHALTAGLTHMHNEWSHESEGSGNIKESAVSRNRNSHSQSHQKSRMPPTRRIAQSRVQTSRIATSRAHPARVTGLLLQSSPRQFCTLSFESRPPAACMSAGGQPAPH